MAIDTLVLIVVLLCYTFLYLLFYTIWTRKKIEYWNRYEKKFNDYFLPLIMNYLEGSLERDELMKKLTKRTQDIRFFLNMVDELSKALRGSDSNKLVYLVEHPFFYNFYQSKLYSFFNSDNLLACIYFEHLYELDNKVIERLQSLCSSNDQNLAFAATKALQSSTDIDIRASAMLEFLNKRSISNLMIVELLNKFYRNDLHQREQVLEKLGEFLSVEEIPAMQKSVIVLFIANQNYYEYGPVLHEYLAKTKLTTENLPLVTAYVRAIGELHVLDAVPYIREYAESGITELQLACIDALAEIGDEENFRFLGNLLLKTAFPVRKKIIETIAGQKNGLQILLHVLDNCHEIIDHHKEKLPVKSFDRGLIVNVKSVSEGIKVMLSQNSYST